jgi:hypothetical protein
MNTVNKLAPLLIEGLALAGFLYTAVNPGAVKKSNESNYPRVGFGVKPVWFWRTIGIVGSTVSLWAIWKIL